MQEEPFGSEQDICKKLPRNFESSAFASENKVFSDINLKENHLEGKSSISNTNNVSDFV